MSTGPEIAEETKSEIPVTRVHPTSDGSVISDEEFKHRKEQEAKAEARLEAYKKDPDSFVHVDDIVIGALRSEHGIGIYFGQVNRLDFDVAFSRIMLRSLELQIQMNMQAALKKKMTGLTDADGKPL